MCCRYVLLEKEVSSVFEQGGASEARLMLDKLKQFIIVDTDTLPYVLEKLCLLFMSLPANHLSIRSVFSAMQVKAVYKYCIVGKVKVQASTLTNFSWLCCAIWQLSIIANVSFHVYVHMHAHSLLQSTL